MNKDYDIFFNVGKNKEKISKKSIRLVRNRVETVISRGISRDGPAFWTELKKLSSTKSFQGFYGQQIIEYDIPFAFDGGTMLELIYDNMQYYLSEIDKWNNDLLKDKIWYFEQDIDRSVEDRSTHPLTFILTDVFANAYYMRAGISASLLLEDNIVCTSVVESRIKQVDMYIIFDSFKTRQSLRTKLEELIACGVNVKMIRGISYG